MGTILQPAGALAADKTPDLKLVGTDGWISMPPRPSDLGLPPGQLCPAQSDRLHLRVRERDGLPDGELYQLKNKAQHSAPLFWAREGDDFRVQLTNVGLAQRPDLFDSHTAPLARLQERHPVLRRRAHRLGVDPAGPDLHLRLQVA